MLWSERRFEHMHSFSNPMQEQDPVHVLGWYTSYRGNKCFYSSKSIQSWVSYRCFSLRYPQLSSTILIVRSISISTTYIVQVIMKEIKLSAAFGNYYIYVWRFMSLWRFIHELDIIDINLLFHLVVIDKSSLHMS